MIFPYYTTVFKKCNPMTQKNRRDILRFYVSNISGLMIAMPMAIQKVL